MSNRPLLPQLGESLDNEELDELHTALLLRNGDDGLLLDGLHGLVTALIVGPQAVTANDWLPLVLDPDQGFDSHLQAEQLTSLCLRLYHSVEQGLEHLVYEPILSEYDDADNGEPDIVVDAHGWCAGFSMGVDLRAHLWEPRLRFDPRLMEIMTPIMALAFAEGLFEDYSDPRWPALSDNERESCLQMIPSAVIDLYHYWREHPPQLDPVVPVRAKPTPRKRGGRWVH